MTDVLLLTEEEAAKRLLMHPRTPRLTSDEMVELHELVMTND